MESLEDALQPAIEQIDLASLVLVSTGEGLREWTYYAKSEQQFFKALNKALGKQKRFPIQIEVGRDPNWLTYEDFRRSVGR